MTDRAPTISIEKLLVFLILALAIWLRLGRLEFTPLSSREARAALAAAELAGETSGAPEIADEPGGGSPAYQALTGLLFALFGTSDALARLAPAIAGVGLAMAPLLAKGALGRPAALSSSALLAISPTLWTAARTAGGPSLAALALFVSLVLLMRCAANQQGGLYWGAAAIGILLASVPWSLTGALGVIFGAGLLWVWDRRRKFRRRFRKSEKIRAVNPFSARLAEVPSNELRRSLAIGAVVLLGTASGLGFMASGLPELFEGLAAWLGGWTAPSSYPTLAFFVSLIAYEPLILVFGIGGAILAMSRPRPHSRFTLAWLVGTLAVVALYPGRQPEDAVWVVIPLGILAGEALIALLESLEQPKDWWAVGGFTVAAIALVVFAGMQLTGYVHGLGSLNLQIDFALQLGLVFMAIGVLVTALIILGLGWGWGAALETGGYSGMLLLLLLTFAAGWQLNFTPMASSGREIFRPQASTEGLRMLSRSLGTISQFETGRVDSLPIASYSRIPATLAWELRNHAFQDSLLSSDVPPIVLAGEGLEEPVLPGDYQGQSFLIGERWGWEGPLPPNIISWLVAREAPVQPERWVLFVRTDIAGVGKALPEEADTDS